MDARSPLRADAAAVLTPFARSDGSSLPPRRPARTVLAPGRVARAPLAVTEDAPPS